MYEIIGIKNVTENILNFNYDKYYRKIGLMLKNTKTESERRQIKQSSIEELNSLLKDVDIDIEALKNNFIKIILDEKSAKYLWILYSKHQNSENYIDMLSSILKQENKLANKSQ